VSPTRWPRPTIMWLAPAIILIVVYFFIRIFNAIADAYEHAAHAHQPVPDMSGGIAAILGGLALLIPPLLQFVQVFHGYHRERMDQQARGIPPSGVPFPQPPPEPSPTGGLVNNEAIQ